MAGDEFAMILEELTGSEAQAKIERLKVAIASAECEFNGARLTLGASFGMAVMMEADSGESLIARADADMYANKHSGRAKAVACTRRCFCKNSVNSSIQPAGGSERDRKSTRLNSSH